MEAERLFPIMPALRDANAVRDRLRSPEARVLDAARTREWEAVQACTLTPEQEDAVERHVYRALFGEEPPIFGRAFNLRKAVQKP